MGAAGSAAQEQRSARGMVALIAVVMFSAFAAFGQESPAPSADPSSSPSSDAAPVLRLLPANTEIHLRMLESVGSATHRRGDRFKLEVADVVELDGDVIIPAGTPAQGEVIHAAKAGMSGRAGELILVVRFLNAGDQWVSLRSFSAGSGEDRYDLAAGLAVLGGIPALFVNGKNLVIPAGSDVFAKVRADTSLRAILGVEPVQEAPAAIEVEADTDTQSDVLRNGDQQR